MNAQLIIALYIAYALVLLYVSWTDIRTRKIPNVVIIPAIGIALVAMNLTPLGIQNALLGALVGPLPLIIGRMFSGASQVGMGDIKMAIFIGLILGFPYALVGVILGLILSLLAGAIGMFRGVYTLRSKLPFGPFLAAGTLPVLALVGLILVGSAL